jgi:lysozyme
MKLSPTGLNLIKGFEGFREAPYLCADGVWTIGYGHAIRNGERFVRINQAEAEKLLTVDLKRFEDCVNKVVKVPLAQNQYDALVSLAFNIGCGAFSRSTLLKHVNKKRFAQAAAEFQRWVKGSKGQTINGLVNRRKVESKIFAAGGGEA